MSVTLLATEISGLAVSYYNSGNVNKLYVDTISSNLYTKIDAITDTPINWTTLSAGIGIDTLSNIGVSGSSPETVTVLGYSTISANAYAGNAFSSNSDTFDSTLYVTSTNALTNFADSGVFDTHRDDTSIHFTKASLDDDYTASSAVNRNYIDNVSSNATDAGNWVTASSQRYEELLTSGTKYTSAYVSASTGVFALSTHTHDLSGSSWSGAIEFYAVSSMVNVLDTWYDASAQKLSASGALAHNKVTLAGTPNYITISDQVITRSKLDLDDDTNFTAGLGITQAINTISVTDYIASSTAIDRFLISSNFSTWKSSVDSTEMGYLDGVTSDIQTQLDSKDNLGDMTWNAPTQASGVVLVGTAGLSGNLKVTLSDISQDVIKSGANWQKAYISTSTGIFANASHTHDDRYYTETESIANFLESGGTKWIDLTDGGETILHTHAGMTTDVAWSGANEFYVVSSTVKILDAWYDNSSQKLSDYYGSGDEYSAAYASAQIALYSETYSQESDLTSILNDNYAGSSSVNWTKITAISSGFDGRLDTLEGAGYVDTSGTPADDDFAKFTDADTIEGRSYSETRSDLGIQELLDSGIKYTTAYTHSQDNTQAHSDYLLNSGDDTMDGVLTANGYHTTEFASSQLISGQIMALHRARDIDSWDSTTWHNSGLMWNNDSRKWIAKPSGGGAGGASNLSELTIDADKDWNNKSIHNAHSLSSQTISGGNIYGKVHYTDILFKETWCEICGETFKPGDCNILVVKNVSNETAMVPAHLMCVMSGQRLI